MYVYPNSGPHAPVSDTLKKLGRRKKSFKFGGRDYIFLEAGKKNVTWGEFPIYSTPMAPKRLILRFGLFSFEKN
jgi:hypothetical protein